MDTNSDTSLQLTCVSRTNTAHETNTVSFDMGTHAGQYAINHTFRGTNAAKQMRVVVMEPTSAAVDVVSNITPMTIDALATGDVLSQTITPIASGYLNDVKLVLKLSAATVTCRVYGTIAYPTGRRPSGILLSTNTSMTDMGVHFGAYHIYSFGFANTAPLLVAGTVYMVTLTVDTGTGNYMYDDPGAYVGGQLYLNDTSHPTRDEYITVSVTTETPTLSVYVFGESGSTTDVSGRCLPQTLVTTFTDNGDGVWPTDFPGGTMLRYDTSSTTTYPPIL